MKYINIWDYIDPAYPFQLFMGGRGTGKTYSALDGLTSQKDKFVFMRRTAQELELMLDNDNGEGANPFKPINLNKNLNIGLHRIVKNLAGIYNRETVDGKLQPFGAPIGYGAALSTLSTIRGIDFSDCSYCIYDEFVPEKHVRRMKAEGSALLNAYETMNRNRELEGQKPLYMFMLSNSNDIYNPIFTELGLVYEIEKMLRAGKHDLYMKERALAVHLLEASDEFMQAKSQTAIMKLAKGTSFREMALDNKFAYNDFSLIKPQKLDGFRPVCSIGKATIYNRKNSNAVYVSYAPAKCPQFKAEHEQDVMDFYNRYGRHLKPLFISGRISFESYELKRIILDLIL